MTALYVCPLSRLEETVRSTRASDVVSLMATEADVPFLADIADGRHLRLHINDIVEAMEGQVLADETHVDALVGFVGRWPRQQPMVIHCYAGISRSTAAAFIALCLLRPDVAETDHAAALRRASPTATPNRRLVALADGLLERGGRMVDAVAAIGRGRMAFEGRPFELALTA